VIGWCDPRSNRAAAAFLGRFWLDPTNRNELIRMVTASVAADLDRREHS
jgi:hypothetical protein